MLRILFAGTPELACPSLRLLAKFHRKHWEIAGVLSQPDRPVGRKRKLAPSPVKSLALELGLPVLTPERLGKDCIEYIAGLNADILVVFAYGKIFSDRFLGLFRLGGINLHPSALPALRGPSPIEAFILSGDSPFGLTVQKMVLEMDRGPILLQRFYPVSAQPRYGELASIAQSEGARMLLAACRAVAVKQRLDWETSRPQEESLATYCKRISKGDGLIDWRQSAESIDRAIRAYERWPKSYSFLSGERILILDAKSYNSVPTRPVSPDPPGRILGLDKSLGLLVQTGGGVLAVSRLQRQNRNAVDAVSFYQNIGDGRAFDAE